MPKKIVIAPNSFKGSLSASLAADIIAEEFAARFPDCDIVKVPIADGGEGSVETIISALAGGGLVSGGDEEIEGTSTIYERQVSSPDAREIMARFAVVNAPVKVPAKAPANMPVEVPAKTPKKRAEVAEVGEGGHLAHALIEVAQSSGITRQVGLHPMTSNTYGFGQLILAALDLNVRNFILCIGGSATTDGGCGMAAALGVKFLDSEGNHFVPSGDTLTQIASIDVSGIDCRVRESSFTVLCDVDNPLYGPRGAAYVYAPQKGADATEVLLLDEGLRHFSTALCESFGRCFAHLPGAGAAGGLGAGCLAFLKANLASGADTILDLYNFENHLTGADLVITGEGKFDTQSLSGKAFSALLRATKKAGDIPITVICGTCDYSTEDASNTDLLQVLQERNIKVFEMSEGSSKEASQKNPEKHLRASVREAINSFSGTNKEILS